jgi:hypothetical protein
MSDKKQIMVRLDPGDYEKLREVAYGARVPLAVLARNWIILELERHHVPDDGQGEPKRRKKKKIRR